MGGERERGVGVGGGRWGTALMPTSDPPKLPS